jgi:uncharacterized membrane protein YdjX (TVP38/TMEM64 family)
MIFSLYVFLAGLALTIVALQFPAVKQVISRLGQLGLPGSFLSGILYAFSFTSSTATAIFANSHSASAIATALVAGLGSAVYDLTVFAVIRNQTHHGFFAVIREKLEHRRRKIPNWLSLIIGLIILASPLPDELAAGLMGFTELSVKKFILISFLANVAGIFMIVTIS